MSRSCALFCKNMTCVDEGFRQVILVGRAWYFFSKGKTFNCAWAYPKTQNRKKSEDSRQLTIYMYMQYGGAYSCLGGFGILPGNVFSGC